jgi:electron transfer flavoprotein alpha subunit
MARQIYAYIMHKQEMADDTALEMISAASKIDPGAILTAVVFGSGANLDAVCQKTARHYHALWKIDHERLHFPDAEMIRRLLVRMIPKGALILVPHGHFGMDLSPGLSILFDAPYLPDVVGFEGVEDEVLKAVRQEYGGLVSAHVDCDISRGAVITLRPGSFSEGKGTGQDGRIIDKTPEALEGGMPKTGRRFLEVVEAEVGEVDITQSEILVSVGRGIENEDNLEMIFHLAEAVGGDVSCSRPLVDAKWLEKDRQVGSSGKTVKPKVYMALGISGSFQHIAGIKGNPLILAINKNPKAPIFQVADVGVVADILDFIPDLTDRINETKG